MNASEQPDIDGQQPPPLVRADALPEQVDYRDQGCDLFPSCLRCPLPRCRYDEPGGARAMLNRIRDREMRRLRREQSLPVDEIARRYRVSRRTVFRALEHGPASRGRRGSSGGAHGPRGERGADRKEIER